jgi:uncharacterized protein DUF5372
LGWATVTHPHHPLCGQRLAVIRVRRGADPDLIVRLPDGLHAALSVSWTDYAAPADPSPPPASLPLLDGDGLRQAAELIDRMRQEGRAPHRPGERALRPQERTL